MEGWSGATVTVNDGVPCMQVRGEVHNRDSWCGVQYGSGLLPLFSSSMPRELLTNSPHFKFDDVAMNLYNINWECIRTDQRDE